MAGAAMETINRSTLDPDVMGGKPCIRGLRVTVGTIVGLLAAGRSPEEILAAYPYLEPEDIDPPRPHRTPLRLHEPRLPVRPDSAEVRSHRIVREH